MAKISAAQLKQLVEAAIFVADGPLTKEQLQNTVLQDLKVSKKQLDEALVELELDYRPRGIQLVEVASGYRFQSMDSLSPWLSKMWHEHVPRYSRAMMETLALIAYRQPITRGEIEDVRGVSVSSHIIKTLSERDWIKIVGHKEVPGRPALYATTRQFLDYFSLKSLAELPPIEEFVPPEQDDDELTLHLAQEINQTVSAPQDTSTDVNESEQTINQEQLH